MYVCFVLHVCVEPRTVKGTTMVLQVLVTNIRVLLHFLKIELHFCDIFTKTIGQGFEYLQSFLQYLFTFRTLAVLAVSALKKKWYTSLHIFFIFGFKITKANSSGPNFAFVVFFIFCLFVFISRPLKSRHVPVD